MLSCLIQNTPPRPKRDNSHFGIDEQYPKLEFKKTKLDVKGDEHRRGDCNGDSRSRGGMPPTPVLAPLEDPSRRPQAVQFQQELQGVYRQVGPDEMQSWDPNQYRLAFHSIPILRGMRRLLLANTYQK